MKNCRIEIQSCAKVNRRRVTEVGFWKFNIQPRWNDEEILEQSHWMAPERKLRESPRECLSSVHLNVRRRRRRSGRPSLNSIQCQNPCSPSAATEWWLTNKSYSNDADDDGTMFCWSLDRNEGVIIRECCYLPNYGYLFEWGKWNRDFMPEVSTTADGNNDETGRAVDRG